MNFTQEVDSMYEMYYNQNGGNPEQEEIKDKINEIFELVKKLKVNKQQNPNYDTSGLNDIKKHLIYLISKY